MSKPRVRRQELKARRLKPAVWAHRRVSAHPENEEQIWAEAAQLLPDVLQCIIDGDMKVVSFDAAHTYVYNLALSRKLNNLPNLILERTLFTNISSLFAMGEDSRCRVLQLISDIYLFKIHQDRLTVDEWLANWQRTLELWVESARTRAARTIQRAVRHWLYSPGNPGACRALAHAEGLRDQQG